jgi:endonuclease/exonuclease/phosphatase family metal-dependent hydrolase
MQYAHYDVTTCEEIVRLRRRIAAAGVPTKVSDKNLLIATWNLRAFGGLAETFGEPEGSPKRNLRALAHIAEIVRCFDVIALQEVRDDLTALRKLMDWLGPDWGMIVSDVSRGDKGNQERLGYVFDLRRVRPSGLAGELVLPPLEGNPQEQFDRTPFAVSFKSAEEEFVLLTVHIRFGRDEKDRQREVKAIAEWMAEWGRDTKRYHRDLIVLGDFNINDRGGPLFEAFASTGLNVPAALRHLSTTTGQAPKHYDQIGWFMDQLQLGFPGRAGTIPFQDVVFRELSRSAMSFRVSDHLPLWVEFSIDRSERRLIEKLGLDARSADPFSGVPD